VPVNTMRPRGVMVTAVFVNVVEHPWSQSWPMDRSELECRGGRCVPDGQRQGGRVS
jgi:hypothetical protein